MASKFTPFEFKASEDFLKQAKKIQKKLKSFSPPTITEFEKFLKQAKKIAKENLNYQKTNQYNPSNWEELLNQEIKNNPPSPASTIPAWTTQTEEKTETNLEYVPNPTGGIEVLFGRKVPHTYRRADGGFCDTDRWFDYILLVYDSSKWSNEHGGINNPWMGLQGPNFRCYYPDSSREDWRHFMTSASSGRTLHNWSQIHNYISF